jgi:hypothetical protein
VNVKTSQTEATYALLIDYASHQALRQEFTATQYVISDWTGIPSRTLRRHVAILESQGKLRTRYTGDGIVYSLPDGVVKIPRITEAITAHGVDRDEVYGVDLPWLSGHFEDAGLETQAGQSEPDYQPADWSPAWGRFFRHPPMGTHDGNASEADIERSIFHYRGETSNVPMYAGALPF